MSRSDLSEGQARDLLARYGFRDTHVFKKLNVLSGGERSRLYLACLLLEQPNILFLDEPTNQLDVYSREILEQALINYNGAILAVSHDRMFIERCCNRILGFIRTEVRLFGSFEAYRSAVRSDETNKPENPGPSIPEKSRPQENRRKNRATERREIAMQKERLRALEAAIEELETEKSKLEAAFCAETDPAQYKRYASVINEIENLYAQYMELEALENSRAQEGESV